MSFISKLPTREECQNIVKNSDAFYCTETIVEGFKVEMYDYRLASISDFENNNAFELRGLTFVYNELSKTWERHLLLNKFFNYSQTIGWMPEDLDNKEIMSVQEKLDGSVISFIKFPNGVIRAKSKMSFTSDQAVAAQKIYDTTESIRDFIDFSINVRFTPVFELIGYNNQIVVQYENDYELRCIQVRYEDGSYVDNFDRVAYKLYNIECARTFKMTLPELLKEKETNKENIEGWIITFADGQMAKIKTNRYMELHGLIGPDAFRENLIIQSIINSSIDDVISALAEGNKKEKLIEITELVQNDFNHAVVEFKKLRGIYFNKYNEDRKEFALKYRNHRLFGLVMKTLNTSFRDVENTAVNAIKDYFLRSYNSLGSAKEYIESLKS